MKQKIELLAPGGDVDSIKSAIVAGADAIYCGLNRFNARNRAENISFDDLQGVLRLAHKNSCEVFLTLNIIIVESEIPALINLLNKLVNTSIDGIIIQDLGLFYIISKYFKTLKLHASTQLTTHNIGQIDFLNKLNATRVNLSRELSINEIEYLTSFAHEKNILTEVFVHGSNCVSFSGLCYISSLHGGNSGNRGRCSQPCRDKYKKTETGKEYPLNLKDNSAFFNLKELASAGIDSLKVEGRIKQYHYVFTVIDSWRKQLENYYSGKELINDNKTLYKVFNRDFSNNFLKGNITKDMFIDNPRDHSAIHFAKLNGGNLDKAKQELYDQKTEIIQNVRNEIEDLSIKKIPIVLKVSGDEGRFLSISIKTPDSSFVINSKIELIKKESGNLTYNTISKRFKSLNDTEYCINEIRVQNLQKNLFIPFKEFTLMKKRVMFYLNDSKEFIETVEVPNLKSIKNEPINPTISILISSEKDLYLCNEAKADVYFQLPDGFADEYFRLIDIFKKNSELIPWFPSILIGNDYKKAVEFLEQINPKIIVTNNSGIAQEAYKQNINWIAGPYFNIVNSFALISLKENFNCYGSFISNEINKKQINRIIPPKDFKLYYNIYHPIMLMTNRQCLFYQVTGCQKDTMDKYCVRSCEKTASITNSKGITFLLKKLKGNYNSLYNSKNYLNTNIISDIPHKFSSFFIDLRDIKTDTQINISKIEILKFFENIIRGDVKYIEKLKNKINNTVYEQYKKGI